MVKKNKRQDNSLFVIICIVLSIFAIVAIVKLIVKKDTLIDPDEETCKKCKGE